MSNAIMAFPNRVDATYYTVAFSGGSWLAALPLTNLRDPLLQKKARSSDDSTASTQFTVDLGADRDIRVIAIPGHNISENGTYRITASNVSNFAAPLEYDSGTIDVWGTIYPFGTLPFEHPSWWTGTTPGEDQDDYPMPITVVLDEAVVARYWKFEFVDTSNPDGYVELNRLFMSPGWQPSINMQFGAALGWQDDSQVETSLGGVDFYNVQAKRRIARFTIAQLDIDEALVDPFEMQRELGITKQLFFIYDPEDTTHKARRQFLATMRQLSPLEHISYDRAQVAFELREVK